MRYFIDLADVHSLDKDQGDASILANLLMKNFCKLNTPRSEKEANLKRLKLNQ